MSSLDDRVQSDGTILRRYEPPPGRDELGNIVPVSISNNTAMFHLNDNIRNRNVDQISSETKNNSEFSAFVPETFLLDSHSSSRAPCRSTCVAEAVSCKWEEIVDDWGQASWKNISTGELSWLKPSETEMITLTTEEVNVSSLTKDRKQENAEGAKLADDHAVTQSIEPGNEQARSLANENLSGSDDERAVATGNGSLFFLQRKKNHQLRLKHRKQEATVAARKALAFLEETVSSYHECVRVLSTKNEAEDDTPAFVDAQSLRSLAAGEVGWKYVSRKERKAAKIRAEATRIANEKEAKAVEEVRFAVHLYEITRLF